VDEVKWDSWEAASCVVLDLPERLASLSNDGELRVVAGLEVGVLWVAVSWNVMGI